MQQMKQLKNKRAVQKSIKSKGLDPDEIYVNVEKK